MTCNNCNAPMPDDAMFCAECGSPIPDSQVVVNPTNAAPDDGKKDVTSNQQNKSNKKKIILISTMATILVVIIVAVVMFFSWYNSDEQRLIRALESGDYKEALNLVEENSVLRTNEELVQELLNKIDTLKTQYTNDEISYDKLLEELDIIEKMKVSDTKEDLASLRAFANLLNQSRMNYETAGKFFDAGDYVEAMKYYALVINDDPNYSTAQNRIVDSQDKYRQKTLAEAAIYAEKGEYTSAIAVLKDGLSVLPEDSEFTKQIVAYQDSIDDKKKMDALNAASVYAESGDYLNALIELDIYLSKNGEDADVTIAYNNYAELYMKAGLDEAATLASDGKYKEALAVIDRVEEKVSDGRLDTKRTEYENAYVEAVVVEVDDLLADMKYDEAKDTLNAAMMIAPNNSALIQKMTDIENSKPVLINTLEPINGGFTWNEGTPADPFENTYTGVQNYTILHGNYWNGHSESATHSAEYKVEEKYDCLSFVISPYSDFGSKGVSYIQVYVNGILRYTSPQIRQKTEPMLISAIDISDATYVEIVVHVGGYGCLMLSDVKLSNPVGFESQLKEGYTPVTALNAFNGSMPWSNQFPTDARDNDYSNVQNYAVLHSGSWNGHSESKTHYVEYYLAGEYSSIILDAAPATDFGQSGSAVVRIYVDDILMYTSQTINQKTTKFNTGEIDLTGADYVKVVVELKGYSCTIVSDVLLKDAE